MVKNLLGNAGDVDSILGWGLYLEKGTATHSNILAWRIRWTGKPGRLQSTGDSRGVGHDLAHTQFGQMQRSWAKEVE